MLEALEGDVIIIRIKDGAPPQAMLPETHSGKELVGSAGVFCYYSIGFIRLLSFSTSNLIFSEIVFII